MNASARNRPPEKPEARPKRRFRIGCMGFCVCMFFVLLFSWIGIKVWMVVALNSRVAALRAAGEPTTWAEVVAGYEPVPDEDNMALLLEPLLDRGAFVLDTATTDITVNYLHSPFGARPSAEARKLLRTFLKENAASLAVMHEAARRPQARWPLNAESEPLKYASEGCGGGCGCYASPCMWASGDMLAMESVRPAVQALRAEVAAHVAEGDGPKAARAVFALRRMAGSLDQYPRLVAQRQRAEYGQWTCSSVEDALSRCELSVEDLALLRAELEAEADQLNSRSAVRAARAGSLWVATEGRNHFFNVLGPLMDYQVKVKVRLLSALPGVLEKDALCGLNYTTQWLEVLELAPREQVGRMRVLSEELVSDLDNVLEPRFVAAVALAMLDGDGLTRRIIHAKQTLHIARTALAVEQFRIERGHWPEKLTDLVPDYLAAIPQDWFAPQGSTIIYKRTDTGVRLWSCSGKEWAMPGLTRAEEYAYLKLARDISRFKTAVGRLPTSLSELDIDEYGPFPLNPQTGQPYSYVTNPANPELFSLGGYTDGMSEDEFWKQNLPTDALVWGSMQSRQRSIVFRLLNPELRGATQARFAEEFRRSGSHDAALYRFGYTPARLKELGFSEDAVKGYKSHVQCFKEDEAEERKRRGLPAIPAVPADTQVEPAP